MYNHFFLFWCECGRTHSCIHSFTPECGWGTMILISQGALGTVARHVKQSKASSSFGLVLFPPLFPLFSVQWTRLTWRSSREDDSGYEKLDLEVNKRSLGREKFDSAYYHKLDLDVHKLNLGVEQFGNINLVEKKHHLTGMSFNLVGKSRLIIRATCEQTNLAGVSPA